MAKEVSKAIPVAERIIEFDSEDIRKNPQITDFLFFNQISSSLHLISWMK